MRGMTEQQHPVVFKVDVVLRGKIMRAHSEALVRAVDAESLISRNLAASLMVEPSSPAPRKAKRGGAEPAPAIDHAETLHAMGTLPEQVHRLLDLADTTKEEPSE